MVNYEAGKIYKLYSPSKNIVYIGSTTQPLCKRLSKHLTDYREYNKDNNKTYYTSFMVLECDDYKIELLEDYKCNNRQQLEQKEGEYIKNNICCNKNIAGRTKQEYYETNKEHIRALSKKNYETNKQQITERHKKYYEDNKEKDKERRKIYAKKYYEDNKEEDKERRRIHDKKYYEENKEKIKEQKKQYYLLKKK